MKKTKTEKEIEGVLRKTFDEAIPPPPPQKGRDLTGVGRKGRRSELNEKQRRFADHYVVCLNAKHAAICAGYSQKTAHVTGKKLLKTPYVREYIDARLEELRVNKGITVDFIIDKLREIVDRAMDNGAYAAAVRAVELLGKHIGMWEVAQLQSAREQAVYETVRAFIDSLQDAAERRRFRKSLDLGDMGMGLGDDEEDERSIEVARATKALLAPVEDPDDDDDTTVTIQ